MNFAVSIQTPDVWTGLTAHPPVFWPETTHQSSERGSLTRCRSSSSGSVLTQATKRKMSASELFALYSSQQLSTHSHLFRHRQNYEDLAAESLSDSQLHPQLSSKGLSTLLPF